MLLLLWFFAYDNLSWSSHYYVCIQACIQLQTIAASFIVTANKAIVQLLYVTDNKFTLLATMFLFFLNTPDQMRSPLQQQYRFKFFSKLKISNNRRVLSSKIVFVQSQPHDDDGQDNVSAVHLHGEQYSCNCQWKI